MPESLHATCEAALGKAIESYGVSVYPLLGLEAQGTGVKADIDRLYEQFLVERMRGRRSDFIDGNERLPVEFTSDLERKLISIGTQLRDRSEHEPSIGFGRRRSFTEANCRAGANNSNLSQRGRR